MKVIIESDLVEVKELEDALAVVDEALSENRGCPDLSNETRGRLQSYQRAIQQAWDRIKETPEDRNQRLIQFGRMNGTFTTRS